MRTIEETYCIVDKYTGRDCGLLIINSQPDERGALASEMQVLTLGERPLEAGEYRLEFVKKMMVDPSTRGRFAPIMAANSNH